MTNEQQQHSGSTEKNQPQLPVLSRDALVRRVVINTCFGGLGLSDAAYEKLIEWGVPVRKYVEEARGEDGRYQKVPENEGEVIFDRDLTLPGESEFHDNLYHAFKGRSRFTQRYWETWLGRDNRDHPLLLRAVEELGDAANGPCAKLRIVEIPADAEYEISEYDGNEHIAEAHRTWYA